MWEPGLPAKSPLQAPAIPDHTFFCTTDRLPHPTAFQRWNPIKCGSGLAREEALTGARNPGSNLVADRLPHSTASQRWSPINVGAGLARDEGSAGTTVSGSDLFVQLTAFLLEPLCLLGQALGHVHIHRFNALVGGVLTHFLGDLHRAEFRPAHRAEVRDLGRVFRQGFVVIRARGVRVQAEVELVFPAELEPRLAQGVIADLRPRMALGQIRSMRRDLVSDDPGLHVILVRQPQVFLGRDIAKHRATEPADHRRADARGDVVVAWCNVCSQWAEGVERRLVAALELLVHVLFDQLHRHVAGAFDHGLHVVLPGDLGQFAQCLQLTELRGVVGVGNRARTQAVAKGEADVVGLHDFADFVEMRVGEVLFVVRQAPLGHDRTATRDDAGDALGRQRYVAQQHAGVDGEVVDALLGLFDQGVAEQLPGQVFSSAADFFQGLVDRYGTDRHRRVADDPFAGFVNVFAGGQVHDRVRTPANAPGQFRHFFFNGRTQSAVTDVAVDLHQEVTADDHRFQFGVVDVGRNDRATAGNLVTDKFRGDDFRHARTKAVTGVLLVQQPGGAGHFELHVFADGDVFHLGGDDAFAGVVHLADVGPGLGAARVVHVGETQLGQLGIGEAFLAEVRAQAGQTLGVATGLDPRRTNVAQAFAHVDDDVGVGVRAGGVVHHDRCVDLTAEVGRGHVEADFAHRHEDVRAGTLDIDFLRAGKRLNRLLIDLGRVTQVRRIFWFYRHHGLSEHIQAVDLLSERTCNRMDARALEYQLCCAQCSRGVRLSNNIPDEAQEDSPGDEKSCSLRRR